MSWLSVPFAGPGQASVAHTTTWAPASGVVGVARSSAAIVPWATLAARTTDTEMTWLLLRTVVDWVAACRAPPLMLTTYEPGMMSVRLYAVAAPVPLFTAVWMGTVPVVVTRSSW